MGNLQNYNSYFLSKVNINIFKNNKHLPVDIYIPIAILLEDLNAVMSNGANGHMWLFIYIYIYIYIYIHTHMYMYIFFNIFIGV